MIERSKLKIRRPISPADSPKPHGLSLFSSISRKFSISNKVAFASLSVIAIFAFLNSFSCPNFYSDATVSDVGGENPVGFPGKSNFPGKSYRPRVYMYDLPTKFTYGIIEQHAIARGGKSAENITALKYPGHQHMHEWFIFSDLNRPEKERVGSPVIRVLDPANADLFYVPAFSSLSLIVNSGRAAGSASGLGYSDEEIQESLVDWLESQEWWRRNKGRDHVIVAGDPNAMNRIMDRIKNAALLVADFGRLRPEEGSIVKDVIIPYSHRINAYEGDLGLQNRPTLLFFMGNRYRKDGGKVRDSLFRILEREEGVVIKHGTQSQTNRRAATRGMHTSKFCLHPAGDTPSACRLFDAIVSLCVPVIVSDNIELPFEDVIDYRKFSVFMGSNAALKPGYLVKKLRKVKPKKILQYQQEMKEVRRYFDYMHPNGGVNEIWRQVSQKLPLIKLIINREKRLVKRESSEPNCFCLRSNHTGIISSI